MGHLIFRRRDSELLFPEYDLPYATSCQACCGTLRSPDESCDFAQCNGAKFSAGFD
jgi:hypothetical protein